MTDIRYPGDPEEPRLLPTIDPASPLGAALHDAVARLRTAEVPREVREMAQKMLDGKATARDLVELPEFQPALLKGAENMHKQFDGLTEEEREEFLRPKGAGAGSRD